MQLLEIIFSAFVSITLAFIGYFLGRSKMKAEVSKLMAETQVLTDNHEINLSTFYRKQVLELMQDVKDLRQAMDKCDECYETIAKLKDDYQDLQEQITLLKNQK